MSLWRVIACATNHERVFQFLSLPLLGGVPSSIPLVFQEGVSGGNFPRSTKTHNTQLPVKYTVNTKFLIVLAIILVMADMFYLAAHPAYRNYKRNEALLRERLDCWEKGFKKDYIASINKVAAALTNTTTQATKPLTKQDVSAPIDKPLDMELDGYAYFEVCGSSGFSIHGRLVFRVGDSFMGRRIVSVDRFGAVLSDGGIIRPSLSSLNRKQQEVSKHDNTTGG